MELLGLTQPDVKVAGRAPSRRHFRGRKDLDFDIDAPSHSCFALGCHPATHVPGGLPSFVSDPLTKFSSAASPSIVLYKPMGIYHEPQGTVRRYKQ